MKLTDEEHRIDRVLNRSNLTKEQVKTLNRVCKEQSATGLTRRTIANKLEILEKFGLFFKKPYEQTTKNDLINYFSKIRNHYAESSLTTIRINIKWFYKWLEKPDVVEWIKTSSNGHNTKLPEELLTQEEIKKLADNTSSLRNKAIIMLLYDGALRIGELVNLKLKSLVFDDYGGYLIIPKSKTGMRRVRLVDSIPYLKDYINKEHPHKNNPDSFLFVCVAGKGARKDVYGEPIVANSVRIMLTRVTEKIKLKKNVYPHLFRHVKMTEMAKDFTEQEMKVFAGWSGSSRMPQIYCHLSGQDVENKILQKKGLIKTETKEEKNLLMPKICIDPSCNYSNPASNKFCEKCHRPLDIRTILDQEKEVEKTMTNVLKKETLREQIKREMIDEIKGELRKELGL